MSITKVSEKKHNGCTVSLFRLDFSGLVKIVREVVKLKLDKSLKLNMMKEIEDNE